MIEETVKRLFEEQVSRQSIEQAEQGTFPAQLWDLVQQNGFTLLMSQETHGGIEADWETTFPLLAALGYYQVPLPVAETVIANLLLSSSNQAPSEAPVALVHERDSMALQLTRSGSQLRLSGSLASVAWVRWCDSMLVGLPNGQLALVPVQQPGVSLSPRQDLSRMPADSVTLHEAIASSVFKSPWPELAQPLLMFGAAARAAMMSGALEFAIDQSVQYAKDRLQFGKAIGAYQAIQQQLALLAGEFSSARVAALMACRDLPSQHQHGTNSALFSVSVAKIRAGDASNQATSIAHQVHGAIGFTYEHALNFATRRLWTWRSDYGSATFWSEQLGKAFIAGRARQFWPSLTARRFPHQSTKPH